ncbi:hypothetical protein [Variovorax paradoxus]|uniref:hypothetical protein n=1 Tax=Variovorax paradoxus TaxID=34073 RepID=UPI0029C99215|nr:hypothetical protein RZE77_09625 [Variovorax paradoxus]
MPDFDVPEVRGAAPCMRNKNMDWNVIGSRRFGGEHGIKVDDNLLHAAMQFGGRPTTAVAPFGVTPKKDRWAINGAERRRRRPIAAVGPRVLEVA